MTTTEEHPLIRHQEIGDNFQGIYYLESVYYKLTVNGKDFTEMMLRDRSGVRPVKAWEKVDGIKKGDFVFVAANVQEYPPGSNSPSIIAKNVEKEDPPAELDNYMPVYEDADAMSDKFDELRDNLKDCCTTIEDETAEMLVEEVFRSSAFFTKFASGPGNDRPYYGRRGGLLASTTRVASAAWDSANHNDLDAVEGAVLLAAGLIHRIGAVDAFEFVDCAPIATKRGILLGVGNLTMTRIAGSMRRMMAHANEKDKTVSQDILMRILHCLSSYDETIQPMTKEALIVAAAYRSDNEIVHASDFIENDPNEDDDFTAWDSSTRRRYFKG